jgi:hypothetical protein
MTFAWWTHQFDDEQMIQKDTDSALRQLTEFYRRSSPSARLQPIAGGLEVERGSLFFSVFGFCPETWCHHTLRINLERLDSGQTKIRWDIELKFCGMTVGKNYLLDECRKLSSMLNEKDLLAAP